MQQRASASFPADVPIYDVDFYSDEFIKDPYPHYAAMRELGPVVYLPPNGNYATTQYAETKEALQNWQEFASSMGGAQFGCDFLASGGSNIIRDPPLHDEIKAILAK